ncbi:class I adenylate-forming enzyme family protein [Tropicibacter naphthalenivorans]|uniref:Long-chain-fatty-acid--CoA ligase n=1 Tax=Tropicibacter naphthalenivorans TaxID=441103 RepID=A0A0P1GZD0_9RHOB|nr:AMP-binding protein [Tropicibacter naphthalenivorans]CUH81644.1 Long-chain-fatty-acid--CoA ligase [Tropicibacter naphthalenivorans]SMC99481.1 Acyl-CoA synthetase (AMP-forming)/AMP-acid ligase II [Tropicibacter naphthalenivorans]
MTRIHELIDRNAAQRPDRPAIRDCDGATYTWAEYAALVAEAAALLESYGAAPGERVLIVAENCLALPVLINACSRLGAWAVPINARMSAAEVARIKAHAAPVVTFYCGHISREAQAHAGAAPEVATAFGTLQVEVGSPDPERVDGDPAILLYTTGTTGDPKGVMLSHGNLLFAAKASADLRTLTEADHVYGALPLTHVFGVASMLMASAHVGAMVELVTRFDPAKLYQALVNGANVLPAVPQMHALLMAHAEKTGISRLEGARLRYVSSGAAPLDPAWKRKAEAFYGIALQNGYGMTESTAGVSGTRNAIGDPDISVGPPLPGVEVALDHSLGADADVGEVLTKGPHVMLGYFRNPQATAQTVQDGWLRTGDLGRIDEAGRLHIVGRAKELIIRGGFNVYPPEVEAALNDHPDIVQTAVIGRAANGDEDILAFAVPRAPGVVSASDLKAFAAERLTGYKRPTHVFIVDALPAAATGKILKHRLLTHFADLVQG